MLSMFEVIGTETYLKEISEWPKDYKETIDKLPEKLANNPFVGDQLSYPFLREKRVKEKRIYFLIYEDLKLVLMRKSNSFKATLKSSHNNASPLKSGFSLQRSLILLLIPAIKVNLKFA